MTLDERFWAKVDASGDCWVWTRGLTSDGYGQHWTPESNRVAHRYAWTQLVGEIPAGLTLDHLCRNRACVNPDHLEVVTIRTNTLRGYGPSASGARQATCSRGHAYDGLIVAGRRICRTCRAATFRRYRANKKGGLS